MSKWKERSKHLLTVIETIDDYLYKEKSIFLYFDWLDIKRLIIEKLTEVIEECQNTNTMN